MHRWIHREGPAVSMEEQHVALPKLYGAPAYARPPRHFDAEDRPLDLDDLPIEAERSSDDIEWRKADLPGGGENGRGQAGPTGGQPRLEGRPFTLRALGRIFTGRP